MRNDALICGRENDLIGFLYGELNEVEAIAFQRHLKECTACNAELNDFGEVRESVVAWRNESLGSVAFPTQVTTPPQTARATPSAVAALREFFNLSPLWMKGAVAAAAVLFCVFAGLALARLRQPPPPPVAVAPSAPAQSQQELKALVEQGVQEELKRLKDSEATAPSPLTAHDSSPGKPVKGIANRNAQVALSASSQKARRPLSKTEREQLASDLRLVSANDGDLDLLDDRINQ